MKLISLFLVSVFLAGNFFSTSPKWVFPYKEAGLSKREAAAHLLNRFTFGPRPGEVDKVVKMGLEVWFLKQLESREQDTALDRRLSALDVMQLSTKEVELLFPNNTAVIQKAASEGVQLRDSIRDGGQRLALINAYRKEKGYRQESELTRQLISQKVWRALYGENQLQELMTDFWFNHFNVALNKPRCAIYIPAYEARTIRPNALGKFETLLVATAQSPAMLFYLDNASSSGPYRAQLNRRTAGMTKGEMAAMPRQNRTGLNENYAREVMELHTLGVDAGYTQKDVTDVARILTGWTVAPLTEFSYGYSIQKSLDRMGANADRIGFVKKDDFFFAMHRHDNSQKQVLGKTFEAGGGYEEGVALFHLLATHPATAHFICRKIATRFVSDEPPVELVAQMAKTFTSSKGDIREVLKTMVSSSLFWKKETLRGKTKSPFELVVSSLRALQAEVEQPFLLNAWFTRMGQPIYSYQAPTGFPDKGSFWINTGALLNRMNFGLALSFQRMNGVHFNLPALNNYHEPESAEAALLTYSHLMMPERPLMATVDRLKPMLNEDDLGAKVARATEKKQGEVGTQMLLPIHEGKMAKNKQEEMLAQVVGLIIGSPEFQRK